MLCSALMPLSLKYPTLFEALLFRTQVLSWVKKASLFMEMPLAPTLFGIVWVVCTYHLHLCRKRCHEVPPELAGRPQESFTSNTDPMPPSYGNTSQQVASASLTDLVTFLGRAGGWRGKVGGENGSTFTTTSQPPFWATQPDIEALSYAPAK